MADVYTTLTFRNPEEFEMYKNAINLDNRNMALRIKDCKLTVIVKTELPLPAGVLIAKTKSGKEIQIQMSSGCKVIVDDHVNIA